MIPWWVWVKRFHLPTAEKVNGRAAMLGYVLALWVDQATGVGLAEQQDSFLGKILLHLTIFGCLFIREVKDIGNLKVRGRRRPALAAAGPLCVGLRDGSSQWLRRRGCWTRRLSTTSSGTRRGRAGSGLPRLRARSDVASGERTATGS